MKAINSESLGQWRQNAPSDIGDEKGVDIGKSEKTAVDRIGKSGLLASFIERWALWIQICAMVAACLCLAPVDTFADEIDDDLAARFVERARTNGRATVYDGSPLRIGFEHRRRLDR